MAGTQNSKALSQYTIQYDLSGTHDPTVIATEAAPGTTYRLLRLGFPKFFLKQDEGTTTNWLEVLTGVSGINLGTGAQVLKNVVGNQSQYRTLKAGSGVSISQGSNEITISFAGDSSFEVPCAATVAVGDLVVYAAGILVTVTSNLNSVIPYGIVGICTGKPTLTTANILLVGKVTGFSGLVTGAPLFVNSSGSFGACPLTGNVQNLGYALSATEIIFEPKQVFRRN